MFPETLPLPTTGPWTYLHYNTCYTVVVWQTLQAVRILYCSDRYLGLASAL